MGVAVLWFRRDLRLADHPALLAARDAAGAGGTVVPVFVLDPVLRGPAGAPRLAYLSRSLRALDTDLAAMGGRLLVRTGDPAAVLPRLAGELGAEQVHVSADAGPYAARRDAAVERALDGDGRALVRTGSAYAVTPGRVSKDDGTGYAVFSAYARAWQRHGWRPPALRPRSVPWSEQVGDAIPAEPDLGGLVLPEAGERAALSRWRAFRDGALTAYADERDHPGSDGTSRMSVHLKYGEVHPRTLLADLGRGAGATKFRSELAWREFYADVLARRPETARAYYRAELAAMRYDTGRDADARVAAWRAGRTGYPIVDAGMRQLLAEGWMHNRVRMVVASFLVKDLHVEWTVGARHFMTHLVDGDLASNSHNWQWVAGTGTDPAPYFRVFNPTAQGKRFDPDGAYVRRWVPELRGVADAQVHEPWRCAGGVPAGYPERIVDHAAERVEALARYDEVR